MKKEYQFIYDENLCIGCQACSSTCRVENEIPDSVFALQVRTYTKGIFPNLVMSFERHSCVMCKNPPCVSVCPTGASFVDKNSLVQIDELSCISCKYCILACPYKARFTNPITKIVQKCDFCYEKRLSKNLAPACVEICPTEALVFSNNVEQNRINAKDKTLLAPKAHLNTKPILYTVANKKGGQI